MAIVECLECQGEVSNNAKMCPRCGSSEYKLGMVDSILVGLAMPILKLSALYLPRPLFWMVSTLLIATYIMGLLNFPFALSFAISEYLPREEIPTFVFQWADLVISVYIEFYATIYEKIGDLFHN
nr:hypothetical protein [uncultured Halomonas sp.]